MSLLDLIFGSSKKIYASQIEKIPASRFNRQVSLLVDGQKQILSDVKLKGFLLSLAQGGISITSLEEKLKKAGAVNNQLARRKEIIEIIKTECLPNDKEKKSKKEKEEEAYDYKINFD